MAPGTITIGIGNVPDDLRSQGRNEWARSIRTARRGKNKERYILVFVDQLHDLLGPAATHGQDSAWIPAISRALVAARSSIAAAASSASCWIMSPTPAIHGSRRRSITASRTRPRIRPHGAARGEIERPVALLGFIDRRRGIWAGDRFRWICRRLPSMPCVPRLLQPGGAAALS